MHEADYVLHLAARTSVPRSLKDPIETNKVNIEGTLNVLVASRDAKVKRIVLAASSSAYGETPTLPKVETMQPEPISPYGVTKYVCEIYAQMFGKVYGLQNVSLRYFNVLARGDRVRHIRACCQVCTSFLKERTGSFGDGEQTRDFTYIENVVQANLLACEAPTASGKVINVGTGERISLNDTLKNLREISGNYLQAKYEPAREGDIRDSQADITLSRELLKYEPTVSFAEGLRRTFDWYQEMEGKAAARQKSGE
jgi:UDP-glucose 4-epimerase